MSHSYNLIADAGHPWTGQPGWDLLEARASTESKLDKLIAAAERRFWNVWIRDNTGQKSVVLYKPSGAMRFWKDTPAENGRIAEVTWN